MGQTHANGLAPLIGNPRALASVQRALASGAPPHAWLFAGPEAVGKATLARWLAQALNCQRAVEAGASIHNRDVSQGASPEAPRPAGARQASPLPKDDRSPRGSGFNLTPTVGAPLAAPGATAPCGRCPACTRIAAGIHSDVQTITIDPNAEGEQRTAPSTMLRTGPSTMLRTGIGVDQVRELERAVYLAPYEGRTRVAIIDPADAMSVAAQNAFLKTLEEPPPHAAFVLIATDKEALLPTVRSRCRLIEFGLVPAFEIEAALTVEGIEPEEAKLLAKLSRGRPGWALAAARDRALLERRRAALEQAHGLPRMTIGERMALSERLSGEWKADRARILALIDEWRGWWREVVMLQSGAEAAVANIDMIEQLRDDASRYPTPDVIAFVRALVAAREQLQANVQSRIALDALLLEAPRSAPRRQADLPPARGQLRSLPAHPEASKE